MPTEPWPAAAPQDCATIRSARVVTGANPTGSNPSLVRPYSPDVSATSCHVEPSASRYWSTQERGAMRPSFWASGTFWYHHTFARSTVTSKSHVSCAHCSPTRSQVPHDAPYFAASSSPQAFVPSTRPFTDSQPEVKDVVGVA